jgi:hypothetical protein
MMNEMKLLWFFFAAAAAFAGDLSQTKAVYILPMAGGLDQYIADRLTQSHVLQVVTDPSRADAVFSDRLGPSFEQRMTELYPPPPPPPAPAKPEAAKTEAAEPPPAAPAAPAAIAPMLGDTVNKLSKPMSSFGGGRGTVFLISVKSRDVLWSTFEKPKDTRGPQLEKTAAKICDDLKKSISGK